MLELIDSREDLTIGALPEDVDLYTSADVRAAGERLLDGGCRYLVLDTSPVTYMDSSGIAALLTLWRRLEKTEGALLLAVPDDHLRWRMGILGLDSVMIITATLQEAVAQARQLCDTAYHPSRHHSAEAEPA
ncbi:STAS domain-containing protein [Streptomyces sp. NPDC085946]|uniref:STAS domain-containing protein n=1 Tax=Streptomyces sp. NPDC085946 TaxID=3365744 RepID=UPI0037D7761A